MPTINTESLLTPSGAAVIMGLSRRRIQKFCEEGRLGFEIQGRYFIPKDQAKKFKPNPPGRPAAKK